MVKRTLVLTIDRDNDLGVKAGIVEKSGSWFSCDSTRIGQGRENAKTFLRENTEMAEMIELKIRQNAGLIAGEMMVGGPDEALSSDGEGTEIEPIGVGTEAK